MALQKILQSTFSQFIIGGLTVSGIGYTANVVSYPALAALIAAIPIGMPSTIFVNDNKIEKYSYNLVLMTIILLLSSICNWVLIRFMHFNKYKSVAISFAFFWIAGGILSYML